MPERTPSGEMTAEGPSPPPAVRARTSAASRSGRSAGRTRSVEAPSPSALRRPSSRAGLSPRLSWTSGVAPRLFASFRTIRSGLTTHTSSTPASAIAAHHAAHHVQGEPGPGAGIQDRRQPALGPPQVLDRHDRGDALGRAHRATIPAPNSSVSDARRARSSASRITDSGRENAHPEGLDAGPFVLVDPVDDHPVHQARVHPGHARGRDLVAERGEHPVRRTLERPSADDRADGHLRGARTRPGPPLIPGQGQDRADAHDRVRGTEDDGVGTGDRRKHRSVGPASSIPRSSTPSTSSLCPRRTKYSWNSRRPSGVSSTVETGSSLIGSTALSTPRAPDSAAVTSVNVSPERRRDVLRMWVARSLSPSLNQVVLAVAFEHVQGLEGLVLQCPSRSRGWRCRPACT